MNNRFGSLKIGKVQKFNIFLRATILSLGFSGKIRDNIYTCLKNKQIFGYEEKLTLSNWPFDININKLENVISEHEKLNLMETQLISIFEEKYPSRLKNIPDPPLQLFIRGELPNFKDISSQNSRLCSSIAVVGTREADRYGLNIARRFSKELAKEGIWIISGLARGIDSAAHLGALDAVSLNEPGYNEVLQSKTIAVFGCGLDYFYPRENERLAKEIVKRGGVLISEYGLNEKPRKHFFPERNRIISGLSDAVWVVEAAKKSGSIITANLAGEQGREILASPGRAGDYLSEGSNNLIKNGATPVTDVEDLFLASGASRTEKPSASGEKLKSKANLTKSSLELVKLISKLNTMHFDELLLESKLSLSELNISLFQLESEGIIVRHAGDYYELGS